MKSTGAVTIWRGHTLSVLVFACVVGAGKTEWARELFRVARHDAWLSVLLGGMVSILLGGMLVWAVALYPKALPGRLFREAFGSWLGGLLSLGFLFYTLAEAARASRTAVALLHFGVLPRTPTWVILAMGVLIAAVVLVGGVQSLLLFQFTLIWPAVLLAEAALALGFRYADWGSFLPLLGEGFAPVIQGVHSMVEPVLGLELGLVYLPYFLRQGITARRALYAVWTGLAAVIFWYLYATVILLIGFGPYEVVGMTWPVMEAVRRTYLTGLFFERLDILFLVSLLIATTSALILYTHAALATLRQTFSLRPQDWQVWALALTVWGIGLLPSNLAEVDWWRGQLLEPLGLIYLIPVPLLLIGTGLVRRYRRGSGAVTS